MKVLCVKIINPVTGQEVLKHPGIHLHAEYSVLSILVNPRRGARFRIMTSDGTPALFDAAMFATVDDRIPPNWVVRVSEGGLLAMAPAKWLESGFWERYFDYDPDAVAVFENEKRIVFGEGEP